MQNISIQGIGNLNPAHQMTGSASIGSTSSIGSISTSLPSITAPSEAEAKSFSNFLGDALSSVSTTMDAAKVATQKMADGSLENLNEMSIAGAKSEVMLHLTTQIASKLCSSATTLFQMQL